MKTKMHWHESRQRLLAENVANADTPGYRVRDLKKPAFSETSWLSAQQSTQQGPLTNKTHPKHIATGMVPLTNQMDMSRAPHFEVTPEGNEVVLEEEMMKVTANQMDYQAATSLYSKTMGLFRIAIGR
ncbi:MAG: flagellar basal body rod protein FlgB [Hyphomicrobiales bacterium]